MNKDDFIKLIKIRQLLKEAYDHYFKYSDGHCKSSEGSISIEFGDYWSDKECKGIITGVSIYSYVLGSSRIHYFDSLDKALETVIQWHSEEMTMTYDYDDAGYPRTHLQNLDLDD
jgi:hypothetical protein